MEVKGTIERTEGQKKTQMGKKDMMLDNSKLTIENGKKGTLKEE